MTESMRQKVERVLRNPGDEAGLAELRELGPQLHAELLEAPFAPPDDVSPERIQWLARVYDAIGDGTAQTASGALVAQPSELTAVNVAFSSVLVKDLPASLTNFEPWFGPAQARILTRACSADDVPAAWVLDVSDTRQLTPLGIHHATEAVSLLIDRLMRHGKLAKESLSLNSLGEVSDSREPGSPSEPEVDSAGIRVVARPHLGPAHVGALRVKKLALDGLRVSMDFVAMTVGRRAVADKARLPGSIRAPAALDRALLTEEIAAVANCSEPTAGALLQWMVAVARHRPLLFRHFVAVPTRGDGIDIYHLGFVLEASRMPRVGSEADNLFLRWGHTLDTVESRLEQLGVAPSARQRICPPARVYLNAQAELP